MTKYELVTNLLKKLQPYREMAEGFLVVIENNWVDDELLDHLLQVMHEAMKELQYTSWHATLHKAVQIIQKIKTKEAEEMYSEEQLEDILSGIDI